MPRRTEEVVIKGRTFRIRQIGADTGDLILFKLGRGVSMQDLSTDDFVFAKNALRDETKVGIVDELGGGNVHFVELKTIYDSELADDLETRVQWLKEAWRVSFGNFSDVVKGLVAARTALSSSTSPKTPDGGSTASSSPTG
jgi:hypothetical protein